MLGAGLMWGTVWAALGALLGIVYVILEPHEVDPGESWSAFAMILGTAGFISGAGFALMLSSLERGRTLHDV